MAKFLPVPVSESFLELTAKERQFLRRIVLHQLQDLVLLAKNLDRHRTPDWHRDTMEHIEIAAGLLAKLPKEDNSGP